VGGLGYVAGFNGSKYLSLGSSSLFDQSGTYTAECWVYATTWNGFIFGTDDYHGMAMELDSATNKFSLLQQYVAFGVIVSTNSFSTNTWYHVVLTSNGTTTKLYVNGVLEGSAILTAGPSSSSWWIGWAGGGTILQGGYLSNFRFVNGVQVYTGNFTVPTAPLSATQAANPFGGANTSAITGTATSLLTLQNSTIIDNSTYGLTFTNTGPVTTSQQTVPFGSGLTIGTFLYDGTTWQSTALQTTGLTVPVANLSVTGGSANQVLSTDGSGTMSFKTGSITVVGRAGNISIPVILS
jgi:hypothetical protein